MEGCYFMSLAYGILPERHCADTLSAGVEYLGSSSSTIKYKMSCSLTCLLSEKHVLARFRGS